MPAESRATGRNTPRHGNHTGETAETRTGPRIGSLFSGAGGLDMAVETVFGGHTVWHSEIDPAASKVLAHHWPDIPNLGDISQVDWATVLPVDILCGGFPCQDVSAAGKRAGIKDGTRSGLWSVFADAIDALRPPIVIIENVRGLLSAQAHRNVEPADGTVGNGTSGPVLRAAGAVLGDLADLGYDAQWATVAASDVGAPHRRERVFILATASDSAGSAGRNPEQQHLLPGVRSAGESGSGPRRGALDCGDATHATRNGWDEGRAESAGIVGRPDAALGGHEDVDLLPTPSAADGGGGHLSRSGDRSAELLLPGLARAHANGDLLPTPRSSRGASTTKTSYALGGERSDSHRTQGQVLLPTPMARDHKDAGPSDAERHSPNLSAIEALLPTPNASDGSGGGQHPDKRAGHSQQGHVLDVTAWGKYGPAIQRWEQLTRPAPAPTEPNKNGNPRLSAAFSEWLMGWPAGWVTDPAIGISRNDQLRIVGNGVCPQQADAAIRFLLGAVGTAP